MSSFCVTVLGLVGPLCIYHIVDVIQLELLTVSSVDSNERAGIRFARDLV